MIKRLETPYAEDEWRFIMRQKLNEIVDAVNELQKPSCNSCELFQKNMDKNVPKSNLEKLYADKKRLEKTIDTTKVVKKFIAANDELTLVMKQIAELECRKQEPEMKLWIAEYSPFLTGVFIATEDNVMAIADRHKGFTVKSIIELSDVDGYRIKLEKIEEQK